MKKPILSVENLWHKYSVQWAIRDINFEITRHGVVGLLGSNGAGKSTTMNIICGVLKQTQGAIYIDGVNLSTQPILAKQKIGFLPQHPPLYMDLTVDEYLTLCAELRMVDKTRITKRVDEAKARCGISHFSHRLLRNLSGGYQQRVGIAQAIVHKPLFVVLDEPTNGLDPNQILDVRRLILEISQDCAVLLSTHILSEVKATCSEIKMIEHGQLVFSGSMEQFDDTVQLNTIHVVLANPAPLEEMKWKGVSQVEAIDGHQFRLHYDGTRETLQAVAAQCVERAWGLEEIRAEKSSMDQVFAKISGNTTETK